jgi:hypothetical protein
MNNPFIDHWGPSKIRVNDGSYTVDEKDKRHRIKQNGHGSYMSEDGTSYTTPLVLTQHLLHKGQDLCPYEFPPSEFFRLYLKAQPKHTWKTLTGQEPFALVS